MFMQEVRYVWGPENSMQWLSFMYIPSLGSELSHRALASAWSSLAMPKLFLDY